MNLREDLYFSLLHALRGIRLGHYYRMYWREAQRGTPPGTTERLLADVLTHCRQNVPYYAALMKDLGDGWQQDPVAYLQRLPILTRQLIRQNFESLKSADLHQRKWFEMTSGGSTGEPVRVLQDYEFSAQAGAIQLLFSRLAGRETGQCEVYLWGSEHEIIEGSRSWKSRLMNALTQSEYINAFRLSPQRMRQVVKLLNQRQPRLITAYVDSIFSLAQFIEAQGLQVKPQRAIITSAGTLYPFMRQQIERVFQCRVYNRYGSREVGNMACERPGHDGLWVAPRGNYIEILDEQGRRVPDGQEGEIIVTSLINYAMPLLRYRIEDRGSLLPGNSGEQVIQAVVGRSMNLFKTRNGEEVHPGYIIALLFHKSWIQRFQVVQKDYDHLLYRFVPQNHDYTQAELDEIAAHTRLVFGADCRVEFEFVEDIPPSGSGKYLYLINEMRDR